jgi:hypothetical protein
MIQKALTDRLMDLCSQNTEKIGEQWYKSVITNPRTPSYRSISKESCMRHAIFIYKNLRRMYFADNPYQEVKRVLDATGYAEDQYSRRIPVAEAIYALILIRRHVWLYAESAALFNTAADMYPTLQSNNRVLLLFDYAIYIVTERYEKLAKQ